MNTTIPISLFADRPIFSSPDDYPNAIWEKSSESYSLYWSYYNGTVLNETSGENLKYPAQINLVRPAVQNHAALLLGQYDDSILKFGIRKSLGIEEGAIKSVTETMNKLWSLNNGDQKMLEQAIMMQVFGGFYFGIRWKPKKKFPIHYVAIDPRNIFPVWDGDDYDRLAAVDVQTQLPVPLAVARYGFSGNVNQQYVNLHEFWSESEYYVEVNGKVATWPDGSQMKGANPFLCPITERTIVPFVYAPRVRSGDFYGESLVSSIMGPQDEFNTLLGDVSDGIADAMHQKAWVRNRPKGATGLDAGSEWIDLGTQLAGAPGAPEVGRLEGATLQESVTQFVTNDLLSVIRMAHGMPDVGYGDTDSSVRSAITLNYMMWPATSLGRLYRQNTAVAMKDLNYKALVMASAKKAWQSDFTVSDAEIEAVLVGHRTHFPPMLPQDRAEVVNEVVQRISAKVISKRHAIEMLDGDDTVEEELALIEEEIKAEQERMLAQQEEQMKMGAKYAPKPDPNQPGGKPKPKDQSTKAQAKGGGAKFGGK